MGSRNRDRDPDANRTDGPATREDFEAAMERVVRAAAANGVRVSGGVGLRHPAPNSSDWGVEITPLRKERVGETDGDRSDTGGG
jgi:hypothetical protein